MEKWEEIRRPFSGGITSSGRVGRKVPENDAQSGGSVILCSAALGWNKAKVMVPGRLDTAVYFILQS